VGHLFELVHWSWRSSALMETGREKWGRWEERHEKGKDPQVWGRKRHGTLEDSTPSLMCSISQESPFWWFYEHFWHHHPNSAMTHYDSHSLKAVSHPHRVNHRSSHLSIYILSFSHDESLCFILLLHFSLIIIWFIMLLPMLYEAELSGTSLWLIAENRLLILTMLLSRSWSPSCI